MTVDDREHPLRRRYALELALGIALIAAAAWVLLGGGEPEDADQPSAPGAPAAGR